MRSTHRRLTKLDVDAITTLILSQAPNLKVTWLRVCEIAEAACGHKFSRQALSANEEISCAYQSKLNEHIKFRTTGALQSIPNDDPDWSKLQKLEHEIKFLKATVDAQCELLVRFVGNAVLAGLSQEILEASLEPRQQDRTDVDKMVDRTREAQRKARILKRN